MFIGTAARAMKKISDIRLEVSRAGLPAAFLVETRPEPFERPRLAAWNESLARSLGIDPGEIENPLLAEYLCGKRLLRGSRPAAMRYGGHQFGVWNPRLGDGRALLLGELRDGRGRKRDLHLKGSGRTAFSRGFDGRAALRSCVREYLGSEAVFRLGIPTTRALSVVGSDEKIERDKTETAAVLLRVARTHVRFGSFEIFSRAGETENVALLADRAMERSFPELPRGGHGRYGLFLRTVAERTAETVAGWQAFGFVHGVMNTDNMSVAGETLDYGPFGFIEKFERDHVSNSSDRFGRYGYGNQPAVARWNLGKFAACLRPLAGEAAAGEALEVFNSVFSKTYRGLMLRRFGFERETGETLRFMEKTLGTLEALGTDYHVFFRNLSDARKDGSFGRNARLERLRETSPEWRRWFSDYAALLRENAAADPERKKRMDSANPLYVMRNHVMETAIRKAEGGDFSEIDRVRRIFEDPFTPRSGCGDLAEPSPEWAEGLSVSCSS